jgi:polysaccharide export outer membrane protein
MQLFRSLARAAVGLTAAALLVTAAQAQTPDPAAGQKPAPVTSAVPGIDPLTYKVGPEDVLEVSVWKEEGLKKELLVRPDGGASYPLVGEVQAAGKTVLELREEIGKRLEKFIPDPVVSVAILKVGSHRIYVIGKVQKPGDFPVGRYIDVLQALSMAGGLTPFADANAIRVMRREGDKQVIIPFEYNRVVRGDKLDQNIQLRAGDVVVVP